MPGNFSNVTLRMKSQHEGALTPQMHNLEKAMDSKYNSTSALSPHEQFERQAESIPQQKKRPYSPVATLQKPCDLSQKWRGTLRFLPQLEMRPYSPLQRCARNPEVPLTTPMRSDFPEQTRVVHQVDTQLERNPKLSATNPRKLKNSPLLTLGGSFTLQCFQRKPTFSLEHERDLDMLYETPEVSRDNRPHSRGLLSFPPQVKKSPVFPASSRDEGRLPCFSWKGMPTSTSHLERRLVSTCYGRGTRGPCHNSKASYLPMHSRSGLISLHLFECQLRINSQHEGSSDAPVANPKTTPCPKFNSAEDRNPFDNSRGKQSSMSPHTSRPDSLFGMAYTARDPRQNRKGNLGSRLNSR